MSAFCHIYGQLSQVGDRIGEELAHMIGLGLICDVEMPVSQLPRHRETLLEIQRRGGLVAPTIYPPDLDTNIRDTNWWKLPAEECERLLGKVQEEFASAGFGPLEAINTYTPGNGLVQACRKFGVRYILGFCAPIVIEDGGWEIAHYGSPLSPYFISDEDYRKPEDPSDRPDPVMMVSMELRNPMVCLNHWSEGPWCPLNALAVDRWLEPSNQPYPFLQVAEDWIRKAELDGQPRLFQINLQYFFAERCYDHNRRALEWIARQRDAGRLHLTGAREWAGRMRDGGGFLRQTTWWSGEMPGYHAGHRPGFFPDVVVDEDLRRQAIWIHPETTPARYYDYETSWNYPAFQPDGSAPASRDNGKITASWKVLEERPGLRRGELIIGNPEQKPLPPLALWEIFADCEGPFQLDHPPTWKSQIVPHPSGSGAMAILETRHTDELRVSLTARFANTQPAKARRALGNLLEARSFRLDGRLYTVLASQTPEPFSVKVRTNGGRQGNIESLRGNDYQQRTIGSEAVDLIFDGSRLACWHRIWDLSIDDLVIEGVDAEESRLRLRTESVLEKFDAPRSAGCEDYQRFGNIRDTSRWDRLIGRAAGLKEMAKINEWFRQQRPDAGEVRVELHAGIFLPRGSITKVLGHEFDVVECADGYDFRELCVDYPQGWDWGVSAWVQWRWLKVRLEGVSSHQKAHTLHLHAFDPEERGLCQRVHFSNPDDPQLPDLCVEPCWEIPRGIDGRWNPGALCSIAIPPVCAAWPSIDVWISPLERIKMDDWIAEKGAPGMISHLWLTAPSS